jgi:hypothetical protein
MTVLVCLVHLILMTIPSRTVFAASSGSSSESPAVPVGAKATPNPEPYSRRISLPSLKILPPGRKEGQLFEPRMWRFSYLCVVGTWNRQSDHIHQFFAKHHDFFNRYKIAAVSAFSHDTVENIAAWSALTKPQYLFGLAQTDFVDQLKNPKVPTCWLISREGQILMKHETPTESQLSEVYTKLKQWTEF